eukprot:272812_1
MGSISIFVAFIMFVSCVIAQPGGMEYGIGELPAVLVENDMEYLVPIFIQNDLWTLRDVVDFNTQDLMRIGLSSILECCRVLRAVREAAEDAARNSLPWSALQHRMYGRDIYLMHTMGVDAAFILDEQVDTPMDPPAVCDAPIGLRPDAYDFVNAVQRNELLVVGYIR